MADGTIRAFIAVPVPEAPRRSIQQVIAALRALPAGEHVRWVSGENLHVTLHFLGNIDPGIAPLLLDRVQEQTAALEPFELTLTRASLFPSARRPRVVALELTPAEPLSELAHAVERGVVAAGLPARESPFRAHLTLGRIRDKRTGFHVTASDTGVADTLPVTEAVLFQSKLQRAGALHTSLGRARLGATGSSASRFTP